MHPFLHRVLIALPSDRLALHPCRSLCLPDLRSLQCLLHQGAKRCARQENLKALKRCPVAQVGEGEPDIFYTDARGTRNRECLSLGCDALPLFNGRTPVQMYTEFIEAFADSFADMLGELPTSTTNARFIRGLFS